MQKFGCIEGLDTLLTKVHAITTERIGRSHKSDRNHLFIYLLIETV